MTTPNDDAVWEVKVFSGPADEFSTLLCQVPGWNSLSISPLGDNVGAGSITIPLASSMFYLKGANPENTPVLQEETLWACYQDGERVFDFLAETISKNQVQDDETQTVTISGPGTAQTLFWGMAMPTGWQVNGQQITKLSGISDSFDTPFVNNPNAYELDLNLWNLSTATPSGSTIPYDPDTGEGGPVTQQCVIIQEGTVSVNTLPEGGYLGGGPFDATNSSFSANIAPVGFNQGAVVPLAPVRVAVHTATTAKTPTADHTSAIAPGSYMYQFSGSLPVANGSGVMVVVQGTAACDLYIRDKPVTPLTGATTAPAPNTYNQAAYAIGDAAPLGPVVWIFFAYNVNGVDTKDVFTVSADISQTLLVDIFSIEPGWQLDTGFTDALGGEVDASLPAQVLQASPELEVVVLATTGTEVDPISVSPPYELVNHDGSTSFQNYVYWAASGETGLAEGDAFVASFPSSGEGTTHGPSAQYPWLITGCAFYWTGETPTTATLDGSEVTELIIEYAPSTPEASYGYAMMGLSYQNFYCQFQDNKGTVTTKILSQGVIGANTDPTVATTVYDSSWAAYWRISCDILAANQLNDSDRAPTAGDKIWRFWTSGDGASWTLQWVVRLTELSFDPSSVNVFMGGSSDQAGTSMQVTSINGEISYSPSAGPIFLNEPAMSTFYQLLQRCQARGTIPWIHPTFNETQDSSGADWTDSWSLQVPAGTDLLSLIQNDAGGVGADWYMGPNFQLECGTQGNLGKDLHESVVFHYGETTELGETQTRDQIGNIVVTSDGAGVLYVESSAASIAQWHQRERWLSAGGTIDAQSAANVAEAGLGQLAQEVQARVIQIPPNQPGKTVFKDLNVFDFIGVERSDFSTIDSVEILGITVTVDQDGAETDELILQSYRQYVLQWLQYLINKFGGQSAATLGALTAGTLSNGLPVVSLGNGLASNYFPISGSVGGSSGALGITPSLYALPEIVSGAGIPGAIIQDGSIAESALSFSIAASVAAVGGVTGVTYSETPPLNPVAGAVWYDGTQWTFWDGTEWEPFLIGPGSVSFTAADLGGGQVYVQATTPTGPINPDSIWFNTASGNQPNIFTDDEWVPFQWGTGSIATDAITANEILAGSVTAQEIAAGTLTANEISAQTITAAQILAGTITTQLMSAGTVVSGLVVGAVIDSVVLNSPVINAVTINGGQIVLGGADDGTYCYGQNPSVLQIYEGTGSVVEWVAPFTGNIYVAVQASGGGGGGGALGGAGGASGGGCAVCAVYPVVEGVTYYFYGGKGGTGTTSLGNLGNDSWFNSSNTAGGVHATGGQGGHADGQNSPAGTFVAYTPPGGSAVFGFSGGEGGEDTAQAGGGAGGGGGAGTNGNGANGLNTGSGTGTAGGTGGDGTGGYPGGGGGKGGSDEGRGIAGANGGYPGGGGGGGAVADGNGGNGGNGRVIIAYTPPSGALVSSITGAAGVDPVNGSPVPQGLYGPVLELTPQAVQPELANAIDAQIWAGPSGAPMAATGGGGIVGSVPVVQQDVTLLTAYENSSPEQITVAWDIPEGDPQVGTKYTIEVPFAGIYKTSTLTFEFSLDGSVTGYATCETGSAFMPTSSSFDGVLRFNMKFFDIGTSGVALLYSEGGIGIAGIRSSGSNNNNAYLSGFNATLSVNTTIAHNMRVNAVWGSAGDGSTVTGYGSDFTRVGP